MAHFNLVARLTGVGLDRDVELVAGMLEAAGHRVTRSHSRDRSFLAGLLPARCLFDVNVFFERVHPRWFGAAPRNVLLPNQERFPARHLPRLRRIDAVLCKTRHATEIFSQHHPHVIHVGFTSPDRRIVNASPDYHRPFHLAGRSTFKGTAALLAAWQAHPEWPTLTLVQHADNAPGSVPANVELITNHLDDATLAELQNACGLHLCPSLAEGWGHYIVEAMSCGAVVVTTDAPPMSELVTNERGLLVAARPGQPRHLGLTFDVEPGALTKVIGEALAAPEDALVARGALLARGAAAREWFERNDKAARRALTEALEQSAVLVDT